MSETNRFGGGLKFVGGAAATVVVGVVGLAPKFAEQVILSALGVKVPANPLPHSVWHTLVHKALHETGHFAKEGWHEMTK